MWSVFGARPFDTLSARRIIVFLLAILMALFTATAYTLPTEAQVTPDANNVNLMATWSGDNLQYNGWTLLPSGNGRNLPSLTGTVCENSKNVYSSDINKTASEPGKSIIVVICLDKGASISDKSKSIPAQILLYRAPEGTTSASKFSPSAPTSINIAPLGTNGDGTSSTPKNATSCDSANTHGIGWIVCPITNFLAAGMDWLFNVLSNFLVVQPISSDQSGALYRAWSFMRNIANVLFVIGFLVIIYSQVTSFGLSSYGVKRMLPRLIIAAIIVNISYWLCAIAIDLSNILGAAFQEMFLSIRNSLVVPGATNTSMNSWQIVNWESIAGFILSGGAIAAGLGVIGFGVVTAGIGASIMLLLPILLGVLMSALVAIIVLAARQALITILVIVSPLAAVAYILPNTEKFFERWRELFGTMLLVFPIFSIVFGGSQLAGTAIILNAPKDGPSGINIILLGMAVQVVPLAITPLLIKVSGNLLNRVAGFVNNPNKGLIDKTRNFTNERAALASARRLGDRNPDGSFKHNWPATRIARRMKYGNLNRAASQKAYESSLNAGATNTAAAHRAHAISKVAHLDETRGENEAENLFNTAVQNNADLRRLDAQSRLSQQEAAYSKTVNDNAYERMKANPIVDAALADVALRAQTLTNLEKTQANRLTTAQRVIQGNYNRDLVSSTAMQEEAGDREIDTFGDMRVKSLAQSQMMAASSERIQNYQKRFIFENTPPATILAKATGAMPTADTEEWEAAVNSVVESNNSDAIIRLTQDIDLTTAPESVRQTLSGKLIASPSRPIYATMGKLNNDIPQGLVTQHGPILIDNWMVEATNDNKYDAEALSKKASKDEIQRLREALIANGGRAHLNAGIEDALKADIRRSFKDEELFRALGNRRQHLRRLGEDLGLIADDFDPNTP